MSKFKQLIGLIVIAWSVVAPAAQSDTPAELRWVQRMKHEQDIPFSAPQGRHSRLGMLVEMGEKHPAVDCTSGCNQDFNMRRCLDHCELNSGKSCQRACDSAKETRRVACRLGLVGATYYLTGFQEITKRSEVFIWHAPNSSLNIEAYAYMKERELGIPCERSVFMAKFPTRTPSPGESRPPITRVEVCRAWEDYFEAAGHGIARPLPPMVEGYSETSGLPFDEWVRDRQRRSGEINSIQAKMWKAHTFAILHAYWQNLHKFKRSVNMSIAREEYLMWMGWNRLVGGLIPELNLNSCASNAEFLAYQLMPNCVVGERLANGRTCKGTPEPGASVFGAIKSEVFHTMQTELASEDFIHAIEAFSSPMEDIHKVPYRWPRGVTEPMSFDRAR